MSKIEKIIEDLSNLTVLEAAELAKALEERWGVSAAAPVAVAAAGAAPAAAEEKTEFTLILKGDGGKKLDVIKAVREIRGDLSLPQAKAFVESAPQPILENVAKDALEKAKKILEAAGAQLEVK